MECKNVLIIDDDPAVLQSVRDVLEIEGYQVFSAKDGKDAIEQLDIITPEPCAILLDLMMPVMSGWEFLDFQRASSKFRKIPVIVCSAYLESARAIKPSAVVEKPVRLEPLLGAIRSFCA